MPLVLLAYYCALILVASIIGGMIPVWFQLTHRWMQFAVSFVAGVMLGVAVLHMLPHAIVDAVAATAAIQSAENGLQPNENASALGIEVVVRCDDRATGRHADHVFHRAVLLLPSPRCASRGKSRPCVA